MTRRVLILTASTGAGHMSAARALQIAFEENGHSCRTIDCMDICSPGFRSWYRGGYERLVLKKPWVWGHLYRTSDKLRFNYFFQTFLDLRFMRPIEDLIRDFRPDWVVCTHSLPQPQLDRLRSKYGFLVGVVVTDLYPHRMWIRGRPDLYCVPTAWSKDQLMERIGEHPSVYVTGIPIGPEFTDLSPVIERNRPIQIMVTAGGIGGGPVQALVSALSRLKFRAKVDVFCGSNLALYNAISEIQSGDVEMRAISTIPNGDMARYMRGADILIGKPGGLTTSEALACGLPFLILDPCMIPGQEEKNAEFLVEVGAGRRASSVEEAIRIVESLWKDSRQLDRMRESATANGMPNAAAEIERLIA